MKISTSFAGSPKGVDILGAGCFEGGKNYLQKSIGEKKFSGKPSETLFVPTGFKSAKTVFLIGLGKKEKFTLEKARQAAAKLLSQAKSLRYGAARLDLDTFAEKFPLDALAGAAVEGARLSDYRFTKYKSEPEPSKALTELDLFSTERAKAESVRRAVREAETVSEGVLFTRDVANEPANVMTPQRMAEIARRTAARSGLACRVFGKAEIRRLRMGGILAVSQGSSHPPRFVILENKVKNSARPVVIVGKGITFDTGGISIKPSNEMDKMKFDMCGAAAVMGTMKVIADLKIPVKAVGLAPLCENMPGPSAQRPGDIITCLNGKTVEVLNTDAEGRLILADALAYAARYKPRALVDIATLTGACAATFGDVAIGLMGTDPQLVNRICQIGERTGERCWELPLWDEYFDLIKATYADIQNISKKHAGTITAGLFLKEFTDHAPSWAHLDIAGTAWNESGSKPLSPIGATGVGVRLLVELIKSYV